MFLTQMKKKALRLIEEISTDETKLTDDPDIEAKLNDVINQIMFELCRLKRPWPTRSVMWQQERCWTLPVLRTSTS